MILINNKGNFYTVRGYALLGQDNNAMTPSMEDYLEMIFRLSQKKGYVRIGDLAESVNVQPPSASKMVQKLAEMGYVVYEKYGIIHLTEQGDVLGEYLLDRHQTIEKFLMIIGVQNNILEETEKIEHGISEETLRCIKYFTCFFLENESWLKAYNTYLNKANQKPGDE